MWAQWAAFRYSFPSCFCNESPASVYILRLLVFCNICSTASTNDNNTHMFDHANSQQIHTRTYVSEEFEWHAICWQVTETSALLRPPLPLLHGTSQDLTLLNESMRGHSCKVSKSQYSHTSQDLTLLNKSMRGHSCKVSEPQYSHSYMHPCAIWVLTSLCKYASAWYVGYDAYTHTYIYIYSTDLHI